VRRVIPSTEIAPTRVRSAPRTGEFLFDGEHAVMKDSHIGDVGANFAATLAIDISETAPPDDHLAACEATGRHVRTGKPGPSPATTSEFGAETYGHRNTNLGDRMNIDTKRILMPLVVAIGLGTGLAHGKECKGVNFPDQAQVEGSALTLNGLGLRQATFLKVNVYVAALYVAKTSGDPKTLLGASTPSELILHFVRDVGADDLRKGWSEGFEKNAKAEMPSLKERIGMLNGWMADIKTNERLTFVHVPGTGVLVSVNGTPKGTIKGDDFAKAFLSIWLGADPPNPEIKAGLLGGACG